MTIQVQRDGFAVAGKARGLIGIINVIHQLHGLPILCRGQGILEGGIEIKDIPILDIRVHLRAAVVAIPVTVHIRSISRMVAGLAADGARAALIKAVVARPAAGALVVTTFIRIAVRMFHDGNITRPRF